MSGSQNYINHVALVLDASTSMSHLRESVIKVADDQIAYLARRSKEMDQETRITVYVFADEVKCVIYDRDVLRMPSLREHYRPRGMTALVAATLKSQDDLALTPEIYGDHAFLTFVITDGQENASHASRSAPSRDVRQFAGMMRKRLATQPDNWTVAVMVPDQMGVHEAKQFGFPRENIEVWDASSARGVEEAGHKIRVATDTFMTNRASGIRGSRSVFSSGADSVNANTIKAAGLVSLSPQKYMLTPVTRDVAIKEWVESECGLKYQLGKCFYQLSKTETIQGNKLLAVVEESTARVFVGNQVRDLLGLGGDTVRVKPDHNPKYKIFVQSTSVNRKLRAGTSLLVMTS